MTTPATTRSSIHKMVRQLRISTSKSSNASTATTSSTQTPPTTRPFSSRTPDRMYISPYSKWYNTIQTNQTFLYNDTQFHYPQTTKTTKSGIPEHKLKFKTTNYGRLLDAPHVRPNEHKVTVQVHMNHLPLSTDIERQIFLDIVGTRYDTKTHVIKLSSNQFGSRIENKRHVMSMLDRIVLACKSLSSQVYEEMKSSGLEFEFDLGVDRDGDVVADGIVVASSGGGGDDVEEHDVEEHVAEEAVKEEDVEEDDTVDNNDNNEEDPSTTKTP